LNAAISGKLENVSYIDDPVLGLRIPTEVPDVPKEILVPRATWKDREAYDEQAKKLVDMFRNNFGQVCKECGIRDDVIPLVDTE